MRNIIMENINCNLCGLNDYTILYEMKEDKVKTEQGLINKFRSSGDETLIDQVVKCNNCSLIYINPQIKPELIFKGYSEGEDPNFVSQAKGRELTFSKGLKIIEHYTKNKKGKMLDIGTAGGSFLHVAKNNDWEVYGCEPNKWMCNWGKKNYKINIKPGDVFMQKYKDNFFDVVTLWDVLEHTPDPLKTLKECNRILKPNGLLIVNYPDIGSMLSKIMKAKWIFLLSVHLFYFTPKTINAILKRSNFSVLKIKPHFQNLALGYLVFRMEAYSKLLHKLGKIFIKITKTDNLLIPYWLGQTLVVAQKNEVELK